MSSRPEISVTPTRAKIEHASEPALRRLLGAPLPLVAGAFGISVLLGAILGGVLGAILVLLPAALLAWLAYLGWPRLRNVEKLMRGSAIFLLCAIALVAGLSHAILF